MSPSSVDREREDEVTEIVVTSDLVESHTPAGSFPVLRDSSWAGTFPRYSHGRAYKSMETLASCPCLTSFIVPCNKRD